MKVNISDLTEIRNGHPAEIPELATPQDLADIHRQVMGCAHNQSGSSVSKPWTTVAAMIVELQKAWAPHFNDVHTPDRAQKEMRVSANKAFAVLISLLRQRVQWAGGAEMKSEVSVFCGWLADLKMQAVAYGQR